MNKWRYEGTAHGAARYLMRNKEVIENEQLLTDQLTHLMKVAYERGAEDMMKKLNRDQKKVIPFHDWSAVPVIQERHKWDPEQVN